MEDRAARVRNQFDKLKLGEFFSVVSAPQIVETSNRVRRLIGGEEVRAHLLELAEGAAGVDGNSMRRAVFEALAESDWYVGGGFEAVV